MKIVDFKNCTRGELRGISKAIYVVENDGAETFRDQYSFGAVGLRSEKSNLATRTGSQERDWTHFQPGEGQLHRHAASPWKRFWAVDLAGWSPKATALAEYVIYVNVAKRFHLIDHSCFACTDENDVFAMLDEVWRDLEAIGRLYSGWEPPRYSQTNKGASPAAVAA